MSNKEIFDIDRDRYSCITVDTAKLARDNGSKWTTVPATFASILRESVSKWKAEGVRGVWVKAAKKHAHLIAACIECEFEFHHAKPEYVMLKQWLAQDEPDNLPEYAGHYLGAAGFVLNEDDELLVIKERFHRVPKWKLPGGHADKGEDIGAAAEREVLEETGIKCEFVSVVCFRHMHAFRWGCSDFYFICLMRPLTSEIKFDPNEIRECRWMKLKEYIEHPDISDPNRVFAQCYLDTRSQEGEAYALQARTVLNHRKDAWTQVYSVQPRDSVPPAHNTTDITPLSEPDTHDLRGLVLSSPDD